MVSAKSMAFTYAKSIFVVNRSPEAIGLEKQSAELKSRPLEPSPVHYTAKQTQSSASATILELNLRED